MTRFRPYPHYRDSGIEWLGKIPKHWKVRRLKWMCRRITDGSHYSPPSGSNGRSYVTVANIVDEKVDTDGAARISDEDFATLERNGCRPSVGDVLFSKDGTVGKVAVVERDDFVILSSLALLSPSSTTDSSFLAYFLKSRPGGEQIESHYAGTALRRITIDSIVDLLAVQPPLPEQRAIAGFLDRETARIDELIAAKQRLLELLAEKRRALISHAVTKGLDPNVKLKDSGVEWLGKIPEAWDTRPLKRMVSCPVEKGVGSELPFVDLESIVSAEGRTTTGYDWPCAAADDYATFSVNDVLFGKLRPYLAKVMMANRDGCCPTELLVFRPDNRCLNGRYLYYVCLSRLFLAVADATSYGVKMPRTSWEQLGPVRFACPPLPEQRAIVAYIEAETAKLDAVRTAAEKTIGLLKERRAALISAAVTGQIDVAAAANSC